MYYARGAPSTGAKPQHSIDPTLSSPPSVSDHIFAVNVKMLVPHRRPMHVTLSQKLGFPTSSTFSYSPPII